jgi:gamma-glutamylcyclotransferase (GGCT)/AIG2-like uncharacterized protein YtfP
MQSFHIFVYGSLRSGFRSPAYAYVSRYFTFVAQATVKGLLYDRGDYPVAIPTTTDNFIIGELYTINNTNEFSFAIAQLDDYEGLHPDDDEQALFTRKLATVYHHNGKTTDAWVYWFAGDVSGKPIIPSGDVLEYLQQKNA